MLPRLASAGVLTATMLLWLAACAPRVAAPPSRGAHGLYHVVRPGETLYRIGQAYAVRHETLARLNGLERPDRILPGQRIFIPGSAGLDGGGAALRETPARSERAQRQQGEGDAPSRDGIDQQFLWPTSGAIHSHFGPRGAGFHDGIDIAAPAGTPIYAIDDGEVIYSDRLRGYGNMVILRHKDDFLSVYAHNQANLVREGQRVARGEVIARVGATGRVTGPHLHFEIRRYNKAEDPLPYLRRLCCAAAADTLSPSDQEKQ